VVDIPATRPDGAAQYELRGSRAGRPAAARGRRAPRPSGDEREHAILATAERLLEQRPLSEISIDDLARGAGISRPTFYFYFASKDAVLLTLLDRVIAEVETVIAEVETVIAEVPGSGDASGGDRANGAEGAEGAGRKDGADGTDATENRDPARAWRAVIAAFFDTFRAHRAVTLACAQAHATNPEARRLWSAVMRSWAERAAEAIEAERSRGAAPAGPPALDLATALTSMNERVMYAVLAGQDPAPAESAAVDTLLHVWLSSIYQTVTPPRCSD